MLIENESSIMLLFRHDEVLSIVLAHRSTHQSLSRQWRGILSAILAVFVVIFHIIFKFICLTDTLKNTRKCVWCKKPDRRSTFFFRPPAHLCAVINITEILLNVTLSYQCNRPSNWDHMPACRNWFVEAELSCRSYRLYHIKKKLHEFLDLQFTNKNSISMITFFLSNVEVKLGKINYVSL